MRGGGLALCAVAGLGCVADPGGGYAERHPGWVRDFPREEIGLEELLASLTVSNPGRQTLTQVTRWRVLGLGTHPWETIPEARIRAGRFRAAPGRLYVVAAYVECYWSLHRERRADRAFSWYVLRDAHLLAYRHAEFGEQCERESVIHGSAHGAEGFEEHVRAYLDGEMDGAPAP